ncbi:MAG: MFS transporter [Dehalococcoidia bacterium]
MDLVQRPDPGTEAVVALESGPFRLRALAVPIYVPTFLFAVGQGLVVPVLPLYAKGLGAGVGIIGLIVTMRGIGSMAADVPSGTLTARLGGRLAMTLGAAATAVVALVIGLAASVWLLYPLVLFAGAAFALWMVARLAYMSDTIPTEFRGRSLALVGGVNRIGVFVGPVVGGFVGRELGLEWVFYLQAMVCAAAAGIVFVTVQGHDGAMLTGVPVEHPNVVRTLRKHRHAFLTAGSVAVALVLVRHGRQLLIPLWGDAIGLDVAQIGIIFGFSSAVDMTLFYPVGLVMDRWGRKWTIVPCLALLGLSMALIPLTHSFAPFLAVGLLSGLGNGLGSGAVMTLGADLAPREASGPFLGVWRLIGDAGAVSAPATVGALAEVLTLGAAAVATGGIGIAGAAVMAVVVTETLRRTRPPQRLAPGR